MNHRNFPRPVWLCIALGAVVTTAAAVVLLLPATPAAAQLVDIIETEDGWDYVWDPDLEMISENHPAPSNVDGVEYLGGAPSNVGTPEPSTIAMAVLGAFALQAYARRRRRIG